MSNKEIIDLKFKLVVKQCKKTHLWELRLPQLNFNSLESPLQHLQFTLNNKKNYV